MGSVLQKVNLELIRRAQRGNKESIEQLSEQVREHLFGYIYRLTLDYDLAQDLLQDTIIYMIQSLDRLEYPEKFWKWIFRTALGKVQHYNRKLKWRRKAESSEYEQMRTHYQSSANCNDGLTELLRKELSDAVFKAMKRLKFNYRNILVLRCFENLEYSEIAEMLDVSELQSRVLFYRAKSSLRKQLASDGIGSRYFLLVLALFGLATSSAKAISTTTISASYLQVGLPATLLGSTSLKVGLAVTAEMVAIALALPVQMFLYVLGIACLSGLFIFLICLVTDRKS